MQISGVFDDITLDFPLPDEKSSFIIEEAYSNFGIRVCRNCPLDRCGMGYPLLATYKDKIFVLHGLDLFAADKSSSHKITVKKIHTFNENPLFVTDASIQNSEMPKPICGFATRDKDYNNFKLYDIDLNKISSVPDLSTMGLGLTNRILILNYQEN